MKKNAKWVVGTDDVGQSILQWRVGQDSSIADDTDPLAQTYNFLQRLDVNGLALEEDSVADEYDPYNTGAYSVRSLRQLRKP